MTDDWITHNFAATFAVIGLTLDYLDSESLELSFSVPS